jgi:hypothetical protein
MHLHVECLEVGLGGYKLVHCLVMWEVVDDKSLNLYIAVSVVVDASIVCQASLDGHARMAVAVKNTNMAETVVVADSWNYFELFSYLLNADAAELVDVALVLVVVGAVLVVDSVVVVVAAAAAAAA